MFNIKLTLREIITYSLMVFMAVALLVQRCQFKKFNEARGIIIDSLTLANQKLDSTVNKKNQTIYTQDVIVTNMGEQVKKLAQEKFDLQNKYERKVKDVEFYYQAKLKVQLRDTLHIPYSDTTLLVPVDCDDLKVFVKDSMIKVPMNVNFSKLDSVGNLEFYINADINKNDLQINNLLIPDSQYIRVDKMKRNVWQFLTFKPNKFQIKVLHTSPYVQVSGQNSIIYKPKKKANTVGKIMVAGGLIFLGTFL